MDLSNKKSAGSVLLLVLLFQGIWHSRHFVERVTQSLRRMIYDTPKMTYQHGMFHLRVCNHTRDIYRYFILDEVFETARFLKQPRIKRSKRFHYVMTSLVPAPCGVSRRKVVANLAINSENAIEWAEKYAAKMRLPALRVRSTAGAGSRVLMTVDNRVSNGRCGRRGGGLCARFRSGSRCSSSRRCCPSR